MSIAVLLKDRTFEFIGINSLVFSFRDVEDIIEEWFIGVAVDKGGRDLDASFSDEDSYIRSVLPHRHRLIFKQFSKVSFDFFGRPLCYPLWDLIWWWFVINSHHIERTKAGYQIQKFSADLYSCLQLFVGVPAEHEAQVIDGEVNAIIGKGRDFEEEFFDGVTCQFLEKNMVIWDLYHEISI